MIRATAPRSIPGKTRNARPLARIRIGGEGAQAGDLQHSLWLTIADAERIAKELGAAILQARAAEPAAAPLPAA